MIVVKALVKEDGRLRVIKEKSRREIERVLDLVFENGYF